MPVFDLYFRKKNKYIHRMYNTDTSVLICHTPKGDMLMKKKTGEFYIYNPKGKGKYDKIIPLSWNDAKDTVKQYGTLEDFRKYFTLYDKDGRCQKDLDMHLIISPKTLLKARRNAYILGMPLTKFIRHLIDRYDAGNNTFR